jgi:hypothetical protein
MCLGSLTCPSNENRRRQTDRPSVLYRSFVVHVWLSYMCMFRMLSVLSHPQDLSAFQARTMDQCEHIISIACAFLFRERETEQQQEEEDMSLDGKRMFVLFCSFSSSHGTNEIADEDSKCHITVVMLVGSCQSLSSTPCSSVVLLPFAASNCLSTLINQHWHCQW